MAEEKIIGKNERESALIRIAAALEEMNKNLRGIKSAIYIVHDCDEDPPDRSFTGTDMMGNIWVNGTWVGRKETQ